MRRFVTILLIFIQLPMFVDAQEVVSANIQERLDTLQKLEDFYESDGDIENYNNCVFQEISLCDSVQNRRCLANAFFKISRSFANSTRLSDALTYLHRSMQISHEIQDTALLADIYCLLGSVYAETNVYDLSLEYYNKFLEISKESLNVENVISAEFYIALVKSELYETKNDTTSLLEAIAKCESIYDRVKQSNSILNYYVNVPNLYLKAMEFSDEKRAAHFLEKATELYNLGNDVEKNLGSKTFSLYFLAFKVNYLCVTRQFGEAKRAMDRFANDPYAAYFYATAAHIYYHAIKDYRNELKYFEELRKIMNANFSSQMCVKYERNQAQAEYEDKIALYEKQAKQARLEFEEENRRNKTLIKSLSAFFAMLLVIVVIKVIQFANSNKINKSLKKATEDIQFRNQKLQELSEKALKQTEEIRAQSAVIEQQNVNLTKVNENLVGSLRYAYRIQHAAVPSEEMMSEIFPNYFLFWQPRDIVSGDFYWAAQDSKRKYLITADCTGHGVPGALLSMLGLTVINDVFATINQNFTAADILNLIKEKFVESWSKSEGNIEDGIDLAFFVVDNEANTLQYAGAKRPMVRVRNNEALSIKPDKLCIGYNIRKENATFVNNVIDTQPGDMFYAYSDGMVDQFGGDDGITKFGQRALEELLCNIADLPIEVQKASVAASLENWVTYNGNRTAQLDDQILIGIKI